MLCYVLSRVGFITTSNALVNFVFGRISQFLLSVFTHAERFFTSLPKNVSPGTYTKQGDCTRLGAPLDLKKKKKKSHRVYVQVLVKVAARLHTLQHRNDRVQAILGLCPGDQVDTIPSLVRHHSKVELQRRLFFFSFVHFSHHRDKVECRGRGRQTDKQSFRQAGRQAGTETVRVYLLLTKNASPL